MTAFVVGALALIDPDRAVWPRPFDPWPGDVTPHVFARVEPGDVPAWVAGGTTSSPVRLIAFAIASLVVLNASYLLMALGGS